MGGWIAFEMALRLRERGDEVAFLSMIDSAPKARQTTLAMGDNPLLDEAQLLAAAVMTWRGHAAGIAAVQQSKADFGAAQIRPLSHEARWDLALTRLREAGVVAADFPAAPVRRLLSTLMAHTLAFYRYQLPRPGDFPLTVIVNTHPSQVPYKVWDCRNDDGVWGWRTWTSGAVYGAYAIEGGDDHWTLLRQRDSLLKVAAVLQTGLDKAAQSRSA
jgi:thioesterase domain-containing protein